MKHSGSNPYTLPTKTIGWPKVLQPRRGKQYEILHKMAECKQQYIELDQQVKFLLAARDQWQRKYQSLAEQLKNEHPRDYGLAQSYTARLI